MTVTWKPLRTNEPVPGNAISFSFHSGCKPVSVKLDVLSGIILPLCKVGEWPLKVNEPAPTVSFNPIWIVTELPVNVRIAVPGFTIISFVNSVW